MHKDALVSTLTLIAITNTADAELRHQDWIVPIPTLTTSAEAGLWHQDWMASAPALSASAKEGLWYTLGNALVPALTTTSDTAKAELWHQDLCALGLVPSAKKGFWHLHCSQDPSTSSSVSAATH